jgi:CelD/BcsL family acetyltransferase involved in cellulose biosynthesis
LKFERVDGPFPGEEWSEGWDRLLDTASEPSVFLSREWLAAWWRHFGARRELRLVVARDGTGRLAGLAPLSLRRERVGPLAGARILGWAGDEGAGSEYLGPLALPGSEEELLKGMFREVAGEWDLADLRGIREGGTTERLLRKHLSGEGERSLVEDREPCSIAGLPDDYEAFLATLGSKFRTTLRYRTNRLARDFPIRFLRTERPEEIDPHLSRLFEMHQSRWTAAGHPGSFASSAKRAFYREVSEEFLRRGWLRFYHLEVEGVIRASQFGFVFQKTLHSLQEAFDSTFHPQGIGGVGVVLRGMAIRSCIEEGITGYDFLGGVEEFKTRWETRTRYVRRLRAGAPGTRGGLAGGWIAAKTRARELGRRRLPTWVLRAREAWKRNRRTRTAARDGQGESP